MLSKIKKNINNKNICVIFNEDDKSILRLEKYTVIIIKDLQKFYKAKNPKIKIELIYSRKEFDNKLNCKTPKWLVATALKNNIYLFSPSVIEKVSDHKKTEIKKLLTHEFCHVFNSKINKNGLVWMDEGIALFVAKQRKNKNYTEDNLNYFSDYYFEKNIKLSPFATNNGYKISYWAIRKIAEEFNDKKLLELLKINPEKKNCRKKIEKALGYSTKEFIKTLKKASIHLFL